MTQTQAQQPRPAPTALPASDQQASALLDQILAGSHGSRSRVINDALTKRIELVEEVLPEGMKGQAERLVKRAIMTFNRRQELQDCPPAEFIRCVVEAAEIGLAIDGKLCYVVRYKSTWQCQPDYKGLIAVAKRSGQIIDCYGDVICENDTFEHHRRCDQSHLEHTYAVGQPRGNPIGAYAVLKLPKGEWRYEIMGIEDLDKIQARAPAKNGPWRTDPDEMRKKTVFRRALKLYCDDPGFVRALEMADTEYENAAEVAAELASKSLPLGRTSLKPAAKPTNGHAHHLPAAAPPPKQEAAPEEPPVAEQPPEPEREPGGDEAGVGDDTEMRRVDLAANIRDQMRDATSCVDMERGPGTLLTENEAFLGDYAKVLRTEFQSHYKALQEKERYGKTGKPATRKQGSLVPEVPA